MSKIALSGNASGTGTLTIAAPNTNSDFTLSLPATTAPILAGSGITLSASAPANTLVTTSGGNVGIGTSSPTYKFQVTTAGAENLAMFQDGTTWTENGGSVLASYYNNTTLISGIKFSSASTTSGYLSFHTGGIAERARIDTSGNFLFAKTATTATVRGSWFNTVGALVEDQPAGNVAVFFRNSSSGADVGTIVVNASSTSYNTTSDYRLKEAVQPMTGALAKVAALNPVTYKWKADGSDGEGFIAHELQAVVPECVTGEKDGVETYTDEDGVEQTRPRYQGIDTSFLVATLTAAIQELNAKVDAQAAEIAALKGQA